MKKILLAMVMGLALAGTGFAAERGGHFSRDGRGGNDHFYGDRDRGGRFDAGFRGEYVGPRVGVGFSYAPAPYVAAPAYCPPAYYPPVVGGVVVRGGIVRERAFVDRDRDHFRR